MKKLLALMLALALLCCCFAMAAGEMEVVNCEEWVSLREEASTKSERLAEVPLGALVSDCSFFNEGWVYGCYEGEYGYILAKYLKEAEAEVEAVTETVIEEVIEEVAEPEVAEPVIEEAAEEIAEEAIAAPESASGYLLEHEFGGLRVTAEYSVEENEQVYIRAADASGSTAWDYTAACSYSTELQLVDAFIGGTAEEPLVMVYSAEAGLSALDYMSGELVWNIPDAQLSLGGSIAHAVDAEGTMYIGGYYGPDPVAVNREGRLLWQTDFGGTYTWLHEIEISGENLRCHYDMNQIDGEAAVVLLACSGGFIGEE